MSYHETKTNRLQGAADELSIIGPTGNLLTKRDLPSPGTTRWVARRKAEVVAGVRGGLISIKEACQRYNLSKDEFNSWQQLFKTHGLSGLRATRVKKFRCLPARTR